MTQQLLKQLSSNDIADLRLKLSVIYSKLENKYVPTGVDYSTYTTPVNFKESMQKPIHRWYGYKEGFSPSFVRGFIEEFNSNANNVVFDPFGGVGTTALVAKEMGLTGFSMDVSPLGVFASKVKTSSYSKDEVNAINKELKKLESLTSYEILYDINNPTIKKYFDPITMDSLLRIRSFIFNIESTKIKDIFLLALLSLLDEISTHHKNGNGVKKKTHLPMPTDFDKLKELIINRVLMYLNDIASINLPGEVKIFNHSNLEPYKLPQKANIVLTSPPYANCFDYSKVYLTELWVGGFFNSKKDQTNFRESSVASHVHYTWHRKPVQEGSRIVNNVIVPILSAEHLWSKRIPNMLERYFSDMNKFLINLIPNLTNGARIGIVVGNPVYGGIPIASDILLTDIAERLGFKKISIRVYRKVVASSQQMILLTDQEKHFVRESLIILEWNSQKKD